MHKYVEWLYKKASHYTAIPLFIALWQLEILEWCKWWSVPYNFGGLFYAANLWSWRDFWFLVVFLSWLLKGDKKEC